MKDNIWRRTTQKLAPVHWTPTPPGQYDIYPAFPLESGTIAVGFDALAQRLKREPCVVIDGYVGVFWDDFRARLDTALSRAGVEAHWVDVSTALCPSDVIAARVEPFLGGDDPLFGTRFTGQLADFFDTGQLAALQPDPHAHLNVLYGWGAALARWDGFLVYVDLPKNELQFRSRAGRVTNLGNREAIPPQPQYKRFYFVDWPALQAHRAALIAHIDLFVDGQRPDAPTFAPGDAVRAGLERMAHNFFRVRPWFEPGPWGGHWMQAKIPQLPQDVPNYAWSFELITPENGLLLTSDSLLLEIAFDFLMHHDHRAVLGKWANRFGHEFPIRFDFLDTVRGGNLSLQCHPRPDFIREHFGETFTQDETYYILDCEPGATVYLGFQEDVDADEFRAALERSAHEGVAIDVERFVHREPAHRHDLFLIPSGTVHCSGAGNLVLEISATPYIFTFKLYDWMRLDLEGRPRPLNIERAFQNLRFDRKGKRVREELVAHPRMIAAGDDWRLVHLPTHPEHFYDVHRYEFESAVEVETGGSPHVLNLVEGTSLRLETARGLCPRFNYAETFVVPAAAQRYRLVNEGAGTAKVVVAHLKEERG